MSIKLKNSLTEIKTFPVITLESIVEKLEDDAIVILCLIAILPFMQPIPIPGLSSLLGLIVLLQGLALIFSKKPLLTAKMRRTVITHEKFELIYKAADKLSKFTEKISLFKHPITNSRGSHIISGISIVLSAAFLSLPLPIPLSNFIPAVSIALICIGLLEEDIVITLCGHGITLTVIWMSIFSFHLIKDQMMGWF